MAAGRVGVTRDFLLSGVSATLVSFVNSQPCQSALDSVGPEKARDELLPLSTASDCSHPQKKPLGFVWIY